MSDAGQVLRASRCCLTSSRSVMWRAGPGSEEGGLRNNLSRDRTAATDGRDPDDVGPAARPSNAELYQLAGQRRLRLSARLLRLRRVPLVAALETLPEVAARLRELHLRADVA